MRGRSSEAGQAGGVLTLAALALVELEGEDDVFVVAAELTHEALRLAQLGERVGRGINKKIPPAFRGGTNGD